MDAETPDRSADLELVTIYEISKILTYSLDFQRSVRETLNVLLVHLDMSHGLVSLRQDDGSMQIVGMAGHPGTNGAVEKMDAKPGITGQVIRSGSPIVIADITQDGLFLNRTGRDMEKSRGVALIMVPIKNGREVIGILSVDRHPDTPHPPNFDRDVRLLTLIANLIGQTLKLHHAIKVEREQLILETHRLQKQLQPEYDVENVIGRSRQMKEVFADVHQAAPGNATILLRGESGTGKEAIAHAIHFLSPRAKEPMVKINCAALPETLLESELFGHEKGAFTGAATERKGRFEIVGKGTLFLDEIGDISPAFQAKLLRVLQEHEFERVGGNKTLKAQFRLVAATNRNLEEMVQKGEFRADLYFRLNVVAIFLPPLRERKDDIPLLVDCFLSRFNHENHRNLDIAPEVMKILLQCNWPGNVRELENCIERAATMTRGNLIRETDMRCQKGQCFSSILESVSSRFCHPIIHISDHRGAHSDPSTAEQEAHPLEQDNAGGYISERDRLINAMKQCGWVQAKAARLLNLTPRQISYALKKYHIDVRRF